MRNCTQAFASNLCLLIPVTLIEAPVDLLLARHCIGMGIQLTILRPGIIKGRSYIEYMHTIIRPRLNHWMEKLMYKLSLLAK